MMEDHPALPMLDQIRRSRTALGMSRLRLGTYLVLLRNGGLWRSISCEPTFRKFLEAEDIEPRAAHQYMAVAERFVIQLKLSRSELEELARVSMRALQEAAKIITRDNANDVIATLTTLPRTDAQVELRALFARDGKVLDTGHTSSRVSRLTTQLAELSLEERQEFFLRISGRTGATNGAA